MCSSNDDENSLIFLASHSSINAIDAESFGLRDRISLDDHSQTIMSIKCAEIKKSNFFLTVITDTGMLSFLNFSEAIFQWTEILFYRKPLHVRLRIRRVLYMPKLNGKRNSYISNI